MMQPIENMEDILSEQISGFHRYCLDAPCHLCYVSQNLCRMMGLSADSLLHEQLDLYAERVHPADRELYRSFLDRLAQGAPSGTLQYRLVKPDGQLLCVSDTIHTEQTADGMRIGNSVLSDITELKAEHEDLQFLNDTIPCGFLKYTCEKQPKITYINDRMLSILGLPEDQEERQDWMELYCENLYTFIPLDERRRLSRYLERVSSSSVPLAGEISILRCDGTKSHLFGWVTKCRNPSGDEEFQSVCMDISERYNTQKAAEVKRYLSALHDVYDKIFEYDFSTNTVTCLYGRNSAMFRWIEQIPMQMQGATEKWIQETVLPEDQQALTDFFHAFFTRKTETHPGQPPQIRYRARSSDGYWKTYMGLFLTLDTSVSLFCCRNIANPRESVALQQENVSLKSINKNMQELMMHFTDGIAAFEISGDLVTPLYASDNVCGFFGTTKDEWLELMKQKTPIRQFIQRSGLLYDDFSTVLVQGEGEFVYPDLKTGTKRRIKAICSPKSPVGATTRYVMLYDMDSEAQNEQDTGLNETNIYIRTFGYFDVFVDGQPIAFRIQKAKELFALLVDRRGGYVTSDEAISYLWPEEPSSPVTLARYRKVALRLKSILEEYGIPQVVEAVDGKRRIVTDRVQCDLYDYLSGKEEYAQLFKGSYLTNYSWSETTLGELTGENLF